ncbi:MAG: YihA family ribosome biogenesis GTP-binding protein [Bacteroidales bacterium]|nr:YihA family ribosome biogenesis GTP-binding protein [Bacteroidales bacterium]MBR6660594.1 YihA family ribosome biogenesis GTP-binding protein [Bacteroidales bacterium]
MKITQATFAGSSSRLSERPKDRYMEFAFIGRSNVGKSSLINMLCNQKKLAHTSSTPGKTQLVNHFLINKEWYLVDLPGYGYAKMSKTGRVRLEKIIRDYVFTSPDMVNLFVLLDSRLDIQKIDLDFIIELGQAGIPFSIIYTKADKSGVNKLNAQLEKNRETLLNYWEELPPVFITSSETGDGRDDVLSYIESIIKDIKSKSN